MERQHEAFTRTQYLLSKVGDEPSAPLYAGSFETYTLRLERALLSRQEQADYDKYYEQSVVKWEARKKICPVNNELINKYPVRQWYFDNLKGFGKINKHYGVIVDEDPHLRIHVTIEAGNGAVFFCNQEQITYTEDLIFAFEDGRDLHWVENFGDQRRVVLIIDASIKDFPDFVPIHPKVES